MRRISVVPSSDTDVHRQVCNPPEGKLSEEVIMACNQEFAKAYSFARCQLLANYTGSDPYSACTYPAVDMSHISIRLGV